MEVVNTTSTVDPLYYYNNLNSFILNPFVFIVIILIIVLYFVLASSLSLGGDDFNNNSSGGTNIMGIIILSILVILILVNAFQYFFSINVQAYISDIFTNKPKLDIVVNEPINYQPSIVPEIKFRKQVFNIPGNYYNYENAKALCKAYGSDLATYQQIEDSYKNGGEWCNYGWSEGQMALFPTQQKTFNDLQNIPGHEHDCGRPGINGGYIANPQVKFGVNCYGNKPKINEEEEELMKTMPKYPQTKEDLLFDKRVEYWKNKVDEILVSPFNHYMWGEL
uniref:Link domain-containing protein n=1 Tax=viral metagenome TaxID=1070528 RepID=A0A6C0ERP3_9ZZZZ